MKMVHSMDTTIDTELRKGVFRRGPKFFEAAYKNRPKPINIGFIFRINWNRFQINRFERFSSRLSVCHLVE